METSRYFGIQQNFLKCISIMPWECRFLPQHLQFIRIIFKFAYNIFWHFIALHFSILQLISLTMNFDKSLDELISYLMNFGTYFFGYFLLCLFQLRFEKFRILMEFVLANFRKRSAKGEFIVIFHDYLLQECV